MNISPEKRNDLNRLLCSSEATDTAFVLATFMLRKFLTISSIYRYFVLFLWCQLMELFVPGRINCACLRFFFFGIQQMNEL